MTVPTIVNGRIDGAGDWDVFRVEGRAGEQVVLDPAALDPGQVYLEVELSADVPADRAARIEAAATAVRELGYSKTRALEFIGETDPALILQEAREEQLAEKEEIRKLTNKLE